jgi:hypothetical protein
MATLKNRSLALLAWLVVALFMFVGLGTALAGNLDKADAAYERQDYVTAFALLPTMLARIIHGLA